MPPSNTDTQKFRNDELVLRVSSAVDRAKWDESKYEAFIEALCGSRKYQKEAIRTTLRYLLGEEYLNLKELARNNYENNAALERMYGPWPNMEKHLQLPGQLAASLDLATGTGKSYVLYGIAAILLAKGVVDKVLVLCPSTTIEDGLIEKFIELAGRADLRGLLPTDSKIVAPHIITDGSICVENYHAILEHVGSSIRESLRGQGLRVAVLNDEAHHIANEAETKAKRWKEFLVSPEYGFRYVIGVSGTCYVGDRYFSDVIFRYSLKSAIEEKFVKKVEYVSEMPGTNDPDEKWQLIYNRHSEIKKQLKANKIRPLTIIVTPKIRRCIEVADELKAFLVNQTGIKPEIADEQILVVYNNAPDLDKLPSLNNSSSKVEWVVSVSMLNEGWDVKRVFQIVPHEEKAFNSKLLISQVLGRGLRVPDGWQGEQPTVTVFNHDSWASRIRRLVDEILEIERKLVSKAIAESAYHFELHNIDYTLEPVTERISRPKTDPYKLFEKGFINFADDFPTESVDVEFERAGSKEHYTWQTKIKHQTYTSLEVAREMFSRFDEIEDEKLRAIYSKEWPVKKLQEVVENSLKLKKWALATDSIKQKCLQSLGTLRRAESVTVRYAPKINSYTKTTTQARQVEHVSAAELKNLKTIFYTDQARSSFADEQVEFFDEVVEPGSDYKSVLISNRHDFKTPYNIAIADSENERRFINQMVKAENLPHYSSWVKSTPMGFYEVDYYWRKGEHPKRGKFNPDFFIKTDKLILVVEIKGKEELAEISEENKRKNEYALLHFKRINEYLAKEKSPVRYKFNFLTPDSFNKYFQSLREGKIETFQSELDVKLNPE